MIALIRGLKPSLGPNTSSNYGKYLGLVKRTIVDILVAKGLIPRAIMIIYRASKYPY